MGAGAFAKTKIALIGDSKKTNQVADLVLAKMADNDNLEFLERSAIEKVLKEHKLQGSGLSNKQIPVIANILHANIFAVLSSAQVNKKTIPSSLRVFDARNGFCLIDTALPADIEKCTDFISSKLQNLPNPKSLKFVSILAVRNAGAPIKYKRQMAHIAIEVERRLIAMPDVAVLERSELGLVNKERKITKRSFKLASSSYLLDFEFAPTSSVDKVDLRIYILNSSGKELASFNFPDCLKNPPQKIIKALAKYLKTSPSTQIVDNKEEAKRFFEEYKYDVKISRYDTAERKLQSAIVLAPYTPDYLRELITFIQKKARYSLSWRTDEEHFLTLLNSLKHSAKICDEIKKQFPTYNKTLYLQLSPSVIHGMKKLTDKQKTDAEEFLKGFRYKYFSESRKYSYYFDLSDGINSSKELQQYSRYMTRTCRLSFYLDFNYYVSYLYQAALEELINTKKALRKNPDLVHTVVDPPYFFVAFSGYYYPSYYNALEEQVKYSRELIKLAKSHPSKKIKSCGHLLDLFRKTIRNNYDPKKFKHDFKKYLSGDYPNYQKLLEGGFERFHKELYRIMRHEKLVSQSRQGKDVSEKMLVYRLRYAKTASELARLIVKNDKLVLKLRKKCVEEKKREYFFSFAKKLSNGLKGNNAKICQKALNILNYPLVVTRLKQVSDFGISARMSGYAWILNARERNGKLYLLMAGYKSIAIFCFDPLKNSLLMICKIDKVLNIYDSLYKDLLPFYVGKKNFLVSTKNQIIVISRDGTSHSFIKGIPGELVRTMVVLNGRIFAFSGRVDNPSMPTAKETILFSCLPNGSDRKVHISTLRRKKQNIFDKQKAFDVSDLFTDEKQQRIIFVCAGAIGGLWEFDPATKKYKKYIKFANSLFAWGMKDKNKLYIVSDFHNYYIFDLNTKQANFVFSPYGSIKKLKIKPQFYKKMFWARPPFLVQNKRIWFNGVMTISFFLNKQIDIQYIYDLQHSRRIPVLPHPDGRSVLIATKNSIFKITPPKNKK